MLPRRIVDATDVVQCTREIKSEAEIGKLREICAIAGEAFEALPEIAAPSIPPVRGMARTCPGDGAAEGLSVGVTGSGASSAMPPLFPLGISTQVYPGSTDIHSPSRVLKRRSEEPCSSR